ncbi:MAG: hypothetical protein AAGA83_00200 [Cyanobacteria bacterium P01_F01_bin.116]
MVLTVQNVAEQLEKLDDYPSLDKGQLAKNNIVVIYGCSDDYIIAEGFVKDQGDNFYDGGSQPLCKTGFMAVTDNGRLSDKIDTLDEAFELVEQWLTAITVKGEWSPDGTELSWRITLPHNPELEQAPFTLYEDGKPWNQGIVFKVPDSWLKESHELTFKKPSGNILVC